MVQRRLLSLSLLAAAIVLPSHSQVLNQNLVQNPGAESGPAAQTFHRPAGEQHTRLDHHRGLLRGASTAAATS